MHRCDFDQTSQLQSQSRIVSTEKQAKNVQNPFLLNNRHTSKSWWSSLVQFIFKLFVVTGGECRQYTSHVTVFLAVNTHQLLHITLHGSRTCWCASSPLHGHPCRAPECCPFFDSPFLALFLSVCFSYLFLFYLNPELNLFLHVAVIGAIYHSHSTNWGVWSLGRKHLSQDLSGPRKVDYKGKWEVTQDAICWINLRKAQDEGLHVWQNRSHDIIFTTRCFLTALKRW